MSKIQWSVITCDEIRNTIVHGDMIVSKNELTNQIEVALAAKKRSNTFLLWSMAKKGGVWTSEDTLWYFFFVFFVLDFSKRFFKNICFFFFQNSKKPIV